MLYQCCSSVFDMAQPFAPELPPIAPGAFGTFMVISQTVDFIRNERKRQLRSEGGLRLSQKKPLYVFVAADMMFSTLLYFVFRYIVQLYQGAVRTTQLPSPAFPRYPCFLNNVVFIYDEIYLKGSSRNADVVAVYMQPLSNLESDISPFGTFIISHQAQDAVLL